jgi:hypothetical protein
MLNVMRLTFENVPPQTLKDERFDTAEERRHYLARRFVDRMFAQAGASEKSPYPRETMEGGLRWLARGISTQRQSAFLVEQLQPAWLATMSQRWLYWVGSRSLAGLLIGLILAATAEVGATAVGRLAYVLASVVAAAMIGLIDGWRAEKRQKMPSRPVAVRIAAQALIAALVAGGCFYMAFGLWLRLGDDGWRLAAGAALAYGLLFGLGGARAGESGDIRLAEALTWSWHEARHGFLPAMPLMLIAVAVVAVIFARSNPLLVWLRYGLVYGAVAALGTIMIFGLRGKAVELLSYPNQGTWLAARNAARAGSLLGLAAGAAYGAVYGILPGLVVALRVGLLAALWYGAFDLIKHLTLRSLLVAAGQAPWNLVRFLNRASELGLLQKVGGAYMFVNRLVQEHFQQGSNRRG